MNTKQMLTFLSLLALAFTALSACYTGAEYEYTSDEEALTAEEDPELKHVTQLLQEALDNGTAESFPHPDDVSMAPDGKAAAVTFTVEEVRLRHASTSQCIYGNSVEDGAVHTWVCWNDPNMTYKIYTHIQSNTKYLIHKATNKYIESYPYNGATVTNRSGYNPYMPLRFVFDDAGSGKVRIRNYSDNQCLYAAGYNGGTVHNWVCWNDPNMAFYIDPV